MHVHVDTKYMDNTKQKISWMVQRQKNKCRHEIFLCRDVDKVHRAEEFPIVIREGL